ncbi:MAG: hypothetical protein JJV98_01460, partial [Desulfosarcina sp.]|nr:hypothetical protein [Desulfobacterales bacterium]
AAAQRIASRYGRLNILGPVEAAMHRVAGQYRWQILVRGHSAAKLNRFVNDLLYGDGPGYDRRGVKVFIDVDPLFMM